jgi:phosphohistidine phosphatase SixA
MVSPAVRTANTDAAVATHMLQVDKSVNLPVLLHAGSIETFVTITATYIGKDAWH